MKYLVTIACEGGLPLLLLKKENAHLYRYFKNLLEFYHRERHSASCNATDIARRLSTILPRSLRHEIVFKLGGDLVKKIVDLQEEVADALNPIRALDRSNENWRDRLPLPIEDGTVEFLLKNLVREARALSVTEQQRVRWRGSIRINEEITVEKRLDLPKVFSGSFLQRWGNQSEIACANEFADPNGQRTRVDCVDHQATWGGRNGSFPLRTFETRWCSNDR